ncbi:MAG: flagellar filament capping protein FliD [Oscillospiraceae bacterium]|nr:flagellar filament capping protein FliD [Oscillospiraceae bacterium]
MAISSIGTPNRITGLYSGFDTDALIKSMLKMEQLKIDRQFRALTALQWKQNAYYGVRDDLLAFTTSFLGSDSMLSKASYNTFKATSSSAAVTVSAGNDAIAGAMKIDIEQLATGAKATSAVGISVPGGTTSAKLGDIKNLFYNYTSYDNGSVGMTPTDTIKFEINGVAFSFGKNDTLQKMINTVNSSDAGVTMSYSNANDAISITSNNTGAYSRLSIKNTAGNAFGNPSMTQVNETYMGANIYRDKNGKIVYDTTNFAQAEYGDDDRIVWRAISDGSILYDTANSTDDGNGVYRYADGSIAYLKDGSTKANAEYDKEGNIVWRDEAYPDFTDGMVVGAPGTGEVTFDEINGFESLLLDPRGAFGISTDSSKYTPGQDAKFKINDGETITSASNTFTDSGVKFTLNYMPVNNEPIIVSVARDTQPVVDNIKKFVEGYNTLVKKLNDMLSERKTTKEREYVALTDEEKASMTEEQIKSWEEIAKKGLLYNDSGIRSMLSALRSELYTKIEGVGLSPAEIGLGTFNINDKETYSAWQTGGQIFLDEDRLISALERDPDAVMNLFIGENGYMHRINEIMRNYRTGSNIDATNSLDSRINRASDQINALEKKMQQLSEKYYLQFAALETALAKLEAQSSWLASILSPDSQSQY